MPRYTRCSVLCACGVLGAAVSLCVMACNPPRPLRWLLLQVWAIGYGGLFVASFFSIAYKEPRLLPTRVADTLKRWGYPVGGGYRSPVRVKAGPRTPAPPTPTPTPASES